MFLPQDTNTSDLVFPAIFVWLVVGCEAVSEEKDSSVGGQDSRVCRAGPGLQPLAGHNGLCIMLESSGMTEVGVALSNPVSGPRVPGTRVILMPGARFKIEGVTTNWDLGGRLVGSTDGSAPCVELSTEDGTIIRGLLLRFCVFLERTRRIRNLQERSSGSSLRCVPIFSSATHFRMALVAPITGSNPLTAGDFLR